MALRGYWLRWTRWNVLIVRIEYNVTQRGHALILILCVTDCDPVTDIELSADSYLNISENYLTVMIYKYKPELS